MRIGRVGASRGDVVRLFEGGSVAALDEGELLGRFATRGDEAAFEALVERLGPMVLGVCRRMLADPHDVDDAFQATFLVLFRKAGAIRDRDLVAPWLYGVARKVARRARGDRERRAAREQVSSVPEAVESIESDGFEVRAMIDEEIGRLPERHRRAVVLCDVEGLSREEAALRLGWSLNMVRGRLERARGRLRDRLTRRGVAPTGGAWVTLAGAPPVVSPSLLASTTRAALGFAAGRMGMGTGTASASAVALAEGVLRMMMLSKWTMGLAILASAGVVAGGSGLIAAGAQGPGVEPPGKAAVAPAGQVEAKTKTIEEPFRPRSASDLAKARIEAARLRYKIQHDFYEEGRITPDRLMDASRGLMQAELDAEAAKPVRVAAIRAHHDRLTGFLKREEAELEVGRATDSDVSEIKTAMLDAEFALARELERPEDLAPSKPGTNPTNGPRPVASKPMARLALERVEAARVILNDSMRMFGDEIGAEPVLIASKAYLDAELDGATSDAERTAALRSQLARLEHMEMVLGKLFMGREAKSLNLQRLKLDRFEAEFSLAKVAAGSGAPTVADLDRRLSDLEKKLDRLIDRLDAPKK